MPFRASTPLVLGDLAIVGVAGGEFGIRGFFDAYEVATGRRAWRHYTVPDQGETGVESIPEGGSLFVFELP